MGLQMITANRLNDGRVVFLVADGGWTETIADGRVIDTADDVETAIAAVQSRQDGVVVVDPYAIEVEGDGERLQPVSYRERIRAFGPSSHPQFGRPGGGRGRAEPG